jgi:hypothetical protein
MAPYAPKAIILMMARRETRMHHYIWHTVRNTWNSLDASDRQKISDLGWEPPRPAASSDGQPILDNNSGEDFLYMHRQMIASVNAVAAGLGDPKFPKVVGWPKIPAPNDPDFPVPPVWDTGDPGLNEFLKQTKSDSFFNSSMRPWEKNYTDPAKLANWSLGELGSRLEFTIHNRMHMRWCSKPIQIRPDVDPAAPEDIDPKWDDPSYDWLGDTYSSHVNPVFWNIHGWVDDRIADWAQANNITGPIPWKGTWVGKMPPHPAPESLHALFSTPPAAPEEGIFHTHHDHQSDMKQVLKIIIRSGKFHHLYDGIEL